ncbi:class B acid phosphatase, partial [Salmonella enterica subsp. enterica serovar Thompson]|nr:class B acid phosphatase [Salmonella enterica subsp. enterica serovar Thompson]
MLRENYEKITLALSAVCLLFTLNHSANALVSSP